jgi:hypothetical protein
MKAKANDIPEYLKGKSAVEIVVEMHNRFSIGADDDENDYIMYAQYLEKVLVLAVKDALCNCDKNMRVNELVSGVTDGPGDRAIVFLNMVLPKV